MTIEIQSSLFPMVQKLLLWKTLDEAEQEAILALPHTVHELAPAEYIVKQGDIPKSSCLLIGGFAYRQKVIRDGARSIVAIHLPGDIVDLQNSLLERADHSVLTLTKATIALIPSSTIMAMVERFPRVGLAMWYDTLVDGSIFRDWIANVSRREAPARLAHLICEIGVRLQAAGVGQRLSFDMPMTQEQLADALGLTSVHVNRTLKLLEEQGLIARKLRSIHVPDWTRLMKAGDFQADYLHRTKTVERIASIPF